MKSDIEIAESIKLRPIVDVAASIGIGADELEPYGKFMAKVPAKNKQKGKLILVTAINPTKAGEGKTTVSIGLADGAAKIGKSVALALREPSLGPVFGVKGGAAGGGYSQVAPMDDINLHFTGDLHALTSANNLLSAMIDNHIHFGNALKIKNVTWRRCMDMNDRSLRHTVCGLGFTTREDGFDITAASEVMAVLCLASDADDLKKRLGDIVVGYDENGKPVSARDLGADNAMAILLKNAVKPNLVQTLEGTPAFVHGGPFANIAHGCNSIVATKTALSYADYVVTEAGFGADLGAEKFLDIKCRVAGLNPSAVVVVATVRALKCAGGKTGDLAQTDDAALNCGMDNLKKHIENITGVFNMPCIVAINRFFSDTDEEIAIVKKGCEAAGAKAIESNGFTLGGEGCRELAEAVTKLADGSKNKLKFAYELTDTIEEKIEKIVQRIYGGKGATFSPMAKKQLAALKSSQAEKLPVCIAKTQYSLSDNAGLLGRPEGFTINVRELNYRAGAGFIVAVAGDVMLMPGLPRVPNAEKMTIDKDGVIRGLF